MSDEARSALVIVAHPDDAEFLCAGTVARWCHEGWDVSYVLATSGDMGSHDVEMTRDSLARLREREQRGAAKVLGVRECVFLGYPDGFVEDTPEFRGRLVREIRRFRPDVVVTWDPFRGNFNHRDHRLTGLAALDAVYPLARSHLAYPEHLAEGLEPHRVNEVLLAGTDRPNYHVDVTDFFQTKINALRRHRSQVGRYPSRELRKRLRERLAEVGKEPGYPLAEAFHRIEWR
ncbi:MAG TPA: PIG-L deacetylase family protein [Dehalococcoidia bacterium]|nr:PIG-L deacetylase family protein [Dehalococcoidia bacterium]